MIQWGLYNQQTLTGFTRNSSRFAQAINSMQSGLDKSLSRNMFLFLFLQRGVGLIAMGRVQGHQMRITKERGGHKRTQAWDSNAPSYGVTACDQRKPIPVLIPVLEILQISDRVSELRIYSELVQMGRNQSLIHPANQIADQATTTTILQLPMKQTLMRRSICPMKP